MDTIGRLGGDEFAVLLPDASEADAQVVLDRVRDVLAARSPPRRPYVDASSPGDPYIWRRAGWCVPAGGR